MGFIKNDKSKSHLKYVTHFVLSLEYWYKSKNLNNSPKYGGSSSTRRMINACCQNVWLHQQTNAHGHIVFTIANSNISYCINVINVECAWEEISSKVFYEKVFPSTRKTSRIQTLTRKSRFLFSFNFWHFQI